MIKKLFSFAWLPLLLAFSWVGNPTPVKESVSWPLDEIEQYTIRVSPNPDATLEMDYHFRWKVLDSTSEGPLSWVKIGVPNCYVSDLKTRTDEIQKLEYSSDGGAFINVTFRSNHYAQEVVDFAFSFHQERLFTMNGDSVTYRFQPGWFENIRVNDLQVYWPKQDVAYENSTGESSDGKDYLWEQSLSFNQTINVDLAYPGSAFPNKDLNKQYSSETQTVLDKALPFIVIGGFLVFFVLVVVLSKFFRGDDYYAFRGYYGLYHNHWFFFNSFYRGSNRIGNKIVPPPSIANSGSPGHGHFGGGGCACACACACAGGGRAGCARKDFYRSGTIELLQKVLRETKNKD